MSKSDKVYKQDYPHFIGKVVNRRCPDGHRYKIRANKDDDSLFLGCENFPACRFTDEIGLDMLLRLTGTKGLEGFSD